MKSSPVAGLTDFGPIDRFLSSKPADLAKDAWDRLLGPAESTHCIRIVRRGFPADKWILSSAMQKQIRRGHAIQAVKTALVLHAVDPAYLPRRLPIVAFEDIGIGNLAACFDVLFVFGRQRFPSNTSEADQRRLLAGLVDGLARSIKSRAACDIYCLAHLNPTSTGTVKALASSNARSLIAMIIDRDAPITRRTLALHLLTGMSIREGRWPRTLSRFNPVALRLVAERLELPDAITWMLMQGRHTSGLASFIPLVLGTVTANQPLQMVEGDKGQSEYSDRLIRGIPAYSLDMYTRSGKAAIADFTGAIREKHPLFLERLPNERNHSKLVANAIFHHEGAWLDRRLENDVLAGLSEQSDKADLVDLGWPESAPRQPIYQLLNDENRLLWKIRRAHMESAFGAAEGDV